MPNQRAQVTMTAEEVDRFLVEQRTATVATLGPAGAVHLVAMWYAYRRSSSAPEGVVWIETKAKSQKVRNLRRDPMMSLLVEAGRTYDQLRGVALEGHGVVVDDPEVVWRVCVDVFERYTGPYTDQLRPLVEVMARNRVAIRLDVDRVRSWDHRKLGLDPLPLGGTTAAFLQ